MKKLFAILLSCIFAFTLIGCSKKVNEDQYDAIMKKGEIIVGLDDTFAPMGFRDTNNNLVGFDIDLAKAVFEEMGLQVKFQVIDWSTKEQTLNNGNIDVIWNGYTITADRQEKVNFSDPYLNNNQVIVVLANSSIQTKNDLIGKKVGAQASSSSVDALNNEPDLVDQFDGNEPYLYETNDLAFIDLNTGLTTSNPRLDAVVVDEILARYYITLNGESKYRILDDNFGSEQYGVGFRKSDVKLLDKFNQTFNDLKGDGTTKNISETWFSNDIIIK